jgi:polysaccharide export outer membrane protein
MNVTRRVALGAHLLWVGLAIVPAAAAQAPQAVAANTAATVAGSAAVPRDYVIGVEDRLRVVFWGQVDLSAEVVVRPDGKISLPMLHDVHAAGMTPEQLSAAVQTAATKYIRDPNATVIVTEIRSRKVFVIGEVAKPGSYLLGSDISVMQMIAEAGGFSEDAHKDDVVVVRTENGRERRFKFNYNDVVRGKKIDQNIRLLPGDTILVR